MVVSCFLWVFGLGSLVLNSRAWKGIAFHHLVLNWPMGEDEHYFISLYGRGTLFNILVSCIADKSY